MHHVLESSVGTGLVFILVSCDAFCAAQPRTDVAGSGPGVRHRGSHGHDQAVQASILLDMMCPQPSLRNNCF